MERNVQILQHLHIFAWISANDTSQKSGKSLTISKVFRRRRYTFSKVCLKQANIYCLQWYECLVKELWIPQLNTDPCKVKKKRHGAVFIVIRAVSLYTNKACTRFFRPYGAHLWRDLIIRGDWVLIDRSKFRAWEFEWLTRCTYGYSATRYLHAHTKNM